MRFTTAWADVLKENLNLRVGVLVLAFTTAALGVTTVRLSLRTPLLVERGCQTGTLSPSDANRNEAEIAAFVKSALASRFDTDAADARTFLSDQEFHNRVAEQQELEKKSVRQRILVNSVKVQGESINIDSDRIISVGQIRSALPFPIKATIAFEARSETNPYGLLLMNVVPIRQKGDER
jgi:hypothetical protein